MSATNRCSVEGCKREYRAKGYCRVHYKKWRNGAMPKKGRYKRCSEDGCNKPRGRWGLCSDHYQKRAGISSVQSADSTVAAS